jgi:hypothetical protein
MPIAYVVEFSMFWQNEKPHANSTIEIEWNHLMNPQGKKSLDNV